MQAGGIITKGSQVQELRSRGSVQRNRRRLVLPAILLATREFVTRVAKMYPSGMSTQRRDPPSEGYSADWSLNTLSVTIPEGLQTEAASPGLRFAQAVNNDGTVTSWAGLLLRPNFGSAVKKSGPNPWMPENARISQVPVLRVQ